MTRSRRRLPVPMLLVVAVALVWLLARGYADFLARPAPERALSLNRSQPEALVEMAGRALAAGRNDEADAHARLALRSHPFEGRALRILGAVAERRGERERALALMRLAAATTPRESAAQFWLAVNALVDKDLEAAIGRLDRLLRFEPETGGKVLPILTAIAVNPVGAASVAPYLASSPPWRATFMTGVIRSAPSAATVSRLFRAIEAAGGSVSEVEWNELAGRLLALRDWGRLRRLVATMAPDSTSALLRDGGFDGVGRNSLLGWSIGQRLPGADVYMATPDADGNRTLHVVFLDRRVPFRQVSQILLLPPGRYEFSGRARLDDLRAALGLGWNLSCVDSGTLVGKSERMLGSHDWREFKFAFAVPEANCGAQLLQLVLDARIEAEQHVAGKVWYDDFRIVAIPAEVTEVAPVAGN